MVTNSYYRALTWAAVLLSIAAGLYIVSILYNPLIRPILQVLLPFSIAVVLALLLDPAITWMSQRGLSRGTAVALVIFLFLLTVVILAMVLIPVLIRQASELSDNAPKYVSTAQVQATRFMQSNQALLRRLHLPTNMQAINKLVSQQAPAVLSESFKNVGGILQSIISTAVWFVLIPIITVFLLPSMDQLKRKALLFVPEKHRSHTQIILASVGTVFGSYIRGLLTVALIYGFACGIAIRLWGVPYAAILGALAAGLSLIPYIGTISTLILVALVTVVSESAMPTGNPMKAVWVALTILALNQIFDNLLSPKLVGRAVGIHPALAILALLVGGQLFGLVGMIISVPVAASIQLLVIEFYPQLKDKDQETKPSKPPFLTRSVAKLKTRRQRLGSS